MVHDAFTLFPAVAAIAGGLVCLGAEAFLGPARKHQILPWAAALALTIGLLGCVVIGLQNYSYLNVAGIYGLDHDRLWLVGAVLAAGLIGIAGIQRSLARDGFPGGEPYALALFATAGAVLMCQAFDTLALFVGLEIASLAVYALVGLRRHRSESNEALFKYFVMGAVFSALFLYGAALSYGATGSTHFAQAILPGRDTIWYLGHGLMVIGLLFKVGAVPFHFWSPDAYTGAPVAVTGLMGAIIKVGGFAALGTIWMGMCAVSSGQTLSADFASAITVNAAAASQLAPFTSVFLALAVLSILIGNFSALAQTSVRRIVAFSSVAHAGYLLLAFAIPAGGGSISMAPLTVYVVAYALATAGALTAIAGLSGSDDAHDDIGSLAGQARLNPLHGVTLTIFIAATAGLPPTLGFLGKFGILGDLVARGWLSFAIIAMILSVVGAGYYLRLIVSLWMAEPRRTAAAGPGLLTTWTISLAAIALIALLAVTNRIAAATPPALPTTQPALMPNSPLLAPNSAAH